jgi:hypothetical protein
MRRLVSIDQRDGLVRARIYRADDGAELLATTEGPEHEIARVIFLAFLGELPAHAATAAARGYR